MADIQHKVSKYKSYLEANKDGDKVSYIFTKLEQMPITVSVLQSTGIGKVVNSFRKREGNIGIMAKSIVSNWKAIVAEEALRLEAENEANQASNHSEDESDDREVSSDRQEESEEEDDNRFSKNSEVSNRSQMSYSYGQTHNTHHVDRQSKSSRHRNHRDNNTHSSKNHAKEGKSSKHSKRDSEFERSPQKDNSDKNSERLSHSSGFKNRTSSSNSHHKDKCYSSSGSHREKYCKDAEKKSDLKSDYSDALQDQEGSFDIDNFDVYDENESKQTNTVLALQQKIEKQSKKEHGSNRMDSKHGETNLFEDWDLIRKDKNLDKNSKKISKNESRDDRGTSEESKKIVKEKYEHKEHSSDKHGKYRDLYGEKSGSKGKSESSSHKSSNSVEGKTKNTVESRKEENFKSHRSEERSKSHKSSGSSEKSKSDGASKTYEHGNTDSKQKVNHDHSGSKHTHDHSSKHKHNHDSKATNSHEIHSEDNSGKHNHDQKSQHKHDYDNKTKQNKEVDKESHKSKHKHDHDNKHSHKSKHNHDHDDKHKQKEADNKHDHRGRHDLDQKVKNSDDTKKKEDLSKPNKNHTKEKHDHDSKKSNKSKKSRRSSQQAEGLSFEECLFADDAKVSKVMTKKSKKDLSEYEQLKNKFKIKKKGTVGQESKDSKSKNVSSLKRKAEDANLAVPSPSKQVKLSELDIVGALPETSANYRPWRVNALEEKKDVDLGMNFDESLIGTKSYARTQIYSGKKQIFVPELYSLQEICLQSLMNNIDSLEYVGGVPFYILKPVLEKCTAMQLFKLEDFNPQFVSDSDELWKLHCGKDFKGKEPEEFESWRELYLRKHDEREARLKSIKSNISISMAKAKPVRTTKLAYVDSMVKPPRDVRRQQMKYGTAGSSSGERAKRFAHCMDPIAINREKREEKVVKQMAPMMQRTMKMIKNMRR